MLETELKICPFCGSPKVVSVIQDGPRPPRHHYVMCESCSAGGPVFSGSASASASAEDAWNRRAVPEPEQSDWERAETLYRNGPEVLDGERFPAAIAALLAAVRAEERERVMPERMAKALAEFHEWGRTTAISLSPQEHELYDAYAAAIRGSR